MKSGSRFLMSEESQTGGKAGGVLRGAVTAALTNSSRRNLGQNIHPQAPGTEGNLTKMITQEIQNVQKLLLLLKLK